MAESEAGRSDGSSGPGPVAWLFLALMVLITSTTATSAKFAVRELPVALLPLVRFGVAGLCLLPLAHEHAPRAPGSPPAPGQVRVGGALSAAGRPPWRRPVPAAPRGSRPARP